MKKRKVKIATIIWIVFISVTGYAIYDIILFDYFNDIRLEHKKVEIVKNYNENEDSFNKFSEYIEGIGNVQNLEFYEPNQIRFYIIHKNHDDEESNGHFTMDISNDSIDMDIDFQLIKGDSISVSFIDSVFKFSAWSIRVDTDQNDKRIEQLLEYIDVTQEKLNTIKKRFKTLNCKALTKNDQLIKFRYAGDIVESLDYIIPVNKKDIETEIIKIKDRFYYGITNDLIVCGTTTRW